MDIEQHLVRLKRINTDNKGTAVRELGVCNLQFDAFASNRGPVFAPIELERFTRCTATHACMRDSKVETPKARMSRALLFALRDVDQPATHGKRLQSAHRTRRIRLYQVFIQPSADNALPRVMSR